MTAPLPAEGETEHQPCDHGQQYPQCARRGVVAALREVKRRARVGDANNAADWLSAVNEVMRDHGALDVEAGCAVLRSPASAAAGEVRVEWGVRWTDDVIPQDGPVDTWQPTETMRAEFVQWLHRVSSYRVVAYATRTVTTSPWVPVTDDQPKEQDR